MNVYEAIAAVTAEMAQDGISKDRKNQQQGYQFRGIDDVYNALSPMLARHHLCILPRILSRELVERQTLKGGVLFYVTVEAEFDFVSAVDGSRHVARTFGEAMDSADKATNKAMSAAYKYLALLTFCIPTEASPDNDADFTTHEVVGKQKLAHAKGNERIGTTAERLAGELVEAIAADLQLTVVEKYNAMAEDSPELADAVWSRLSKRERDYITAALNEASRQAA